MLAGRPAAYNRAVMAKRSYGSGRLFVYKDKTGKESWYGSWRAGTRRVQRKIGPKRSQGSTSGLTRVQAERELRKRIDHHTSYSPQPSVRRSPTPARSTSTTWST